MTVAVAEPHVPINAIPPPETESAKAPQRPPAFVWKHPFPLNDRIAQGTLCIVRPILSFEVNEPRCNKRVAVLAVWTRLQGDLCVRAHGEDFVCRIVGLDNEDLDIRCHGDLTIMSVSWNDLEMIGAVVPFPCNPGGNGGGA